MERCLALLALALGTGFTACAQGSWRVSPRPAIRKGWGSGAKRVRKPTVLRVGRGYKMWFEGYWGKQDIVLAESRDGVNWKAYAHYEPVLHWTRGEGLVGGPAVIHDERGIYHMWYSYHPENKWGGGREIGYAKSVDGIRWKRFRGNPILSGKDEDVCRNPDRLSVLKHDGIYHMWMSGPGIYYATSQNGIDWQRHGKVRTDQEFPGALLSPQAIRGNGEFLISFHNYDWDKRRGTLRFARSVDGKTLRTGFLPPLENATGPSQLVRVGGQWHVFFSRRFEIWLATIPVRAEGGADRLRDAQRCAR